MSAFAFYELRISGADGCSRCLYHTYARMTQAVGRQDRINGYEKSGI